MSTETQEHGNATSTTEDETNQRTVSDDAANLDSAAKGSEDSSSTSDDVFDASSYEQSFGLPADTLKGVEDAKSALEAIREYTDKTLTAGLLSDAVGGATVAPADTSADKGAESGDTKKDAAGKNPELDDLRAELSEVKESLATREKNDYDNRVAEINRRVDSEIDDWASPKYGTSKSRNFKQAKAVKELQDLVGTHIAGSKVQGKNPPVVESLLRQVRTFHDDEYKPAPAKKNSDTPLGSPGTGSRSAKGDGSPKNIHEALMGNSF